MLPLFVLFATMLTTFASTFMDSTLRWAFVSAVMVTMALREECVALRGVGLSQWRKFLHTGYTLSLYLSRRMARHYMRVSLTRN
jgi:hypothetical protein